MNNGRPGVTVVVVTQEEFQKLVEGLAPRPADVDKENQQPSTGRRKPGEGQCKRCGEIRQVNRHKLCYRCWVITELEKSGWREGQPHPDWCKCEGLGEHTQGDGKTPRGLN